MAAKKRKEKKKAPALKGTLKKLVVKKDEQSTKKAAPKKKQAAIPAGDIISQVMAKVNAEHGAIVVRRASEASTSHVLRRPTGIPDVDVALAGGWPAGSLNVIGGPDGSGKDYKINKTIAQVQKNYGAEARIAIYSTEFPYDKDFARTHGGVKVADTDKEIEEKNEILAKQGLPPLTEEEVAARKEQIGEIILIQGVVMDYGLDIVLELLSTGAFQLIIINSIGVMETLAKEETESVSEHAIQSSEAQLLSRFIPKLFMLLNRPLDDNDTRNETTVLVADQVRANRNQPQARPGVRLPEHFKYQPGSGSRALAHGKAIHLMLHKGSAILDKAFDPPEAIGKETIWELTKGKLGTHEGIKGSYDYFYEDGADVAKSLFTTAVRHGVINQNGAWYEYIDDQGEVLMHVQGGDNARDAIAHNQELYDKIWAATLIAANIFVRYR